jgi:hypothetical protein
MLIQVFVGDSRLMRGGGGVMSIVSSLFAEGAGLQQLQPRQMEQVAFALMNFFE